MATNTKPATVPRWNDDLTNNLEPPEAKKDAGWLFQEIPPSNFENWKENLNGQWWKWIDERWSDGVDADEIAFLDPATTDVMARISATRLHWLTAAGLEFEAVAGRVTAGRDETDGINLKGIGDVKDIEFDDPLNRMSYDVSTDIWSVFNNSETASLETSETAVTAKKVISAEAGVVASVDQHVEVSGDGQFKHGDKFIVIAAMGGIQRNGTYTIATNGEMVATGASDLWQVPIVLPTGKRILEVDARVNGAGTGSKFLFLYRNNAFSTKTTIGSVSSALPGAQFMSITGLTHIVTENNAIWVEFNSGDAADEILFIRVKYDEP